MTSCLRYLALGTLLSFELAARVAAAPQQAGSNRAQLKAITAEAARAAIQEGSDSVTRQRAICLRHDAQTVHLPPIGAALVNPEAPAASAAPVPAW